ncbi:MAG: DNA polymerase III subunit beta [Prevotella sp.]|nr:DNA polymerase III subunit beta [Prevotella sp.]
MHIKISKTSLAEALNNVQSVVGAKTALQVLQNVKVEATGSEVKFTCSDLDTTLVASAECEVLDTGATTIPVKQFASAVGKMVDGTIEISVDKSDRSTISGGSSVFKFNGLAAKEFPVIPAPDGMSCTIESNAIREMLRKTAFAASQDDTRRVLQGVLLDFKDEGSNVKAVGTDGRRLAMLDCNVDTATGFSGQFILPRKAVDLLGKKLPKEGNAELVTAKGQLLVKTPRLVLLTKLIDYGYPNYMQVVPKEDGNVVTMNRAEFLGALDRISVFTSATDTPCVVLTFGDNMLSLNSGDTEFGSSHDEIPVKYDGDKIDMRFNPQYIRDVLMAMDDEEMVMKISNPAKPAIIAKADSSDFTYVVMPLRI